MKRVNLQIENCKFMLILMYFYSLDVKSYNGAIVIINRNYSKNYDDENSLEYLQFTEFIAAEVSIE